MVCVTTLPCKILITTLFMITYIKKIKQSTYYFGSNYCQNFMNIILKESPDE